MCLYEKYRIGFVFSFNYGFFGWLFSYQQYRYNHNNCYHDNYYYNDDNYDKYYYHDDCFDS